jgi:uncharacterized protein (TIGR03066 family)
MRYTICATLFLAFAGLAFADDKVDPAKLVGKWEDKDPPKGQTVNVEFTKDGKINLTQSINGKDISLDGTYSKGVG